jgi:hypothetical protein
LGTPQPGSNPVGGSFNNPQLGAIFITLIRTFLLEGCPIHLLLINLEEGLIIPDKVLVLTRILDGTQFLMT